MPPKKKRVSVKGVNETVASPVALGGDDYPQTNAFAVAVPNELIQNQNSMLSQTDGMAPPRLSGGGMPSFTEDMPYRGPSFSQIVLQEQMETQKQGGAAAAGTTTPPATPRAPSATDRADAVAEGGAMTTYAGESPLGDNNDDMKPRDPKFFAKYIHDRVHDQVTLHPLIVQIMDTLEFQRLRHLHQLGTTPKLFPGATHTRFEHSIGVAHLAMKMAKQIRDNHDTVGPAIELNQRDILCLGIAGLCHDLGHGPFSHLFEGYVNNERKKKAAATQTEFKKWEHEDTSIELVDYLIKKNKIDVSLHGLDPKTDIAFVRLLIRGLRTRADWPAEEVGRPAQKRWMLDIVANKRNGIDVDKLDYFLRDSLSCYGKLPEVNLDRIFNCARVILCDNEHQICYQEKIALALGDLFTLRAKMHKYVYQHRITKSMDEMVSDAMRLSEGHFFITGSNGKQFSLSECVEDMEAYSKVGDWILEAILATNDPNLQLARNVIRKMKQRKIYELVGHYVMDQKQTPEDTAARVSTNRSDTKVVTPEEIVQLAQVQNKTPQLIENMVKEVFVCKARITYGSSGDRPGDPVNHVRFFNPKANPNIAWPLKAKRVSALFSPTEFVETTIMIFSKNAKMSDVYHLAFQRWKTINLGDNYQSIPCINSSPATNRKTFGGDSSLATLPEDAIAGRSKRNREDEEEEEGDAILMGDPNDPTTTMMTRRSGSLARTGTEGSTATMLTRAPTILEDDDDEDH